jgi:hypothetical protein
MSTIVPNFNENLRHIYDLKIFNDKNVEWHDWNTELGR